MFIWMFSFFRFNIHVYDNCYKWTYYGELNACPPEWSNFKHHIKYKKLQMIDANIRWNK